MLGTFLKYINSKEYYYKFIDIIDLVLGEDQNFTLNNYNLNEDKRNNFEILGK